MHDALVATGNHAGLTDDHEVEIDANNKNEKKKVVPNILTSASLTQFHSKYMPCLMSLQKYFVAIQSDDVTLADARTGVSKQFQKRLKPTHELVKCPNFESGINKLMLGQSEELMDAERASCQCFLKSNWPHLHPPNDDQAAPGWQTAVVDLPGKFLQELKQRNATASGNKQNHEEMAASACMEDLSWICPTTVKVEQLFSKCSKVMTADRRKMSPHIFEAIVFLKENSSWWNATTVQHMLVGKWKEQLMQSCDVCDEDVFKDSEF